ATLRKLFDLGAPLTARDAAAPDLLGALSLDAPENDGPPSVTPTSAQPSSAEIDKAAAAPPNHMQLSLCHMANALPAAQANIAAHIGNLASQPSPPALASVGAALGFVEGRVKSFL